ncbi:glycogen debranching N-terminal domain-containing protein [Micromonospora sp. WMMD1082]|uniref:amylo-alpha-1,6-glucosidase n=1 Tax=Micromonospora sp. WMMD1082 TaxID=3016104 RepID=UPI002416427D|nr:glycogen debranching N-terminal domain-containing protein [Micromonospora sp. WMMD1082]MDG4798908.1 glycogen debranching N-terminal domain-containing protein [Micromonospora sp. WMMD1082]
MANEARRPTPADPMPQATRPGDIPSETVRNLPPELGPDAVGVLDRRTFVFSNAAGDVPAGSIGGLVHNDTRLLNRWVLTICGSPLLVLSSGTVEDYSAAFFVASPELPGLQANAIGVRRQRFISNGMHERLELQSYAGEPVSIQLRLAVGTDFADLFEIKETVRDRSHQITRSHARDGSRLEFTYRNGTFEVRTRVLADPPADQVDGDVLVWELHLAPNQEWRCDLQVPLHYDEVQIGPAERGFGEAFDVEQDDPLVRWEHAKPVLQSDSDLLRDVYHKSALDLTALRTEIRLENETVVLLSAGLPWFLTIFGRDTLITAYQTMGGGPDLARGALLALAGHQGTECDDFTDEEPGKILHEYRSGELTKLGLKPHKPYYGTADATQLWLILLSEYWRWTGDDQFVQGLRDNAYAALRWIDEYGDRNNDGYVEYATRSPQGLGNQCWRDSWDGVLFSTGAMPVLPISTCEIQGYTYDAKLRFAELADGPLDDPSLARRLRSEAADLRDRFNRDFWIDDRGGYYALGLDGDNRQIDMMTSNQGHLLWSGIVPTERAAIVAGQLMSDRLFSGWGVRTTATDDPAYNPIGYHRGTVWPHDNSIIACGLARYGFRQEANRIVTAMLDAAQFSGCRLPEAFSGYDRSFGRAPVPYPTACNPQAWASGAPLLFLRTLLGTEPRNHQLTLDPEIPPEIGRIRMTNVSAFGSRWDIEATTTQSYIRLAP